MELDAEVVHVAKTFFGFRPDANLHVHVQDGRKYIEECVRTYEKLSKDKGFRFDMAPFVLNGFSRPAIRNLNARVLIDADEPDEDD